jgi:hypothetical protein
LVSLPAVLIGAIVYTSIGDDYFRPTYLIVCSVFVAASLVFGFAVSPSPREARFRQAWTRLFLGGAVAWTFALAALGLLNLTPLCVGQDNGDGINDLGMCVSYTILVAAVYSPAVLTLLALNAALGGAILRDRKR